MNAEILAEWLRRQGQHVIQTPSSYWHSAGPRIFQAFPYHWTIEPREEEIRGLLREYRGIGLRYSTPIGASQGQISYHVMLEGDSYPLESLPKKARYDVRKGLASAVVEPIPFSRLTSEGWLVRSETLERQGRAGAETENWWRRLCATADGLPGLESWGALVQGELAAYLIAFTCDDCCLILYQQSRTQFLDHGVNNALTWTFTQEALARTGVNRIFYGLHSLDAPESVDRYKFRMAYHATPVRQRVAFHPWLTPFFNAGSYALLGRAARRWPAKTSLAKAEGMTRFYLQGRKPLAEQIWPEPLIKERDRILAQPLKRP